MIARNGAFGFAIVHSIGDMGDDVELYDSSNWFIKTCNDVVDNVDAIVGAGMALIKVNLDNDPDVVVIETGIIISHNLVLTTANIIR